MATLTVQKVSLTGLDTTYAAADAAGDTWANDGTSRLRVKNASAASINVTIDSVYTCSHGFDHDVVVAVPAGGEREIGPFPTDRFGTSPDITYSAAASVTVAVVK